jgi:hypothetical protein
MDDPTPPTNEALIKFFLGVKLVFTQRLVCGVTEFVRTPLEFALIEKKLQKIIVGFLREVIKRVLRLVFN